MVQSYHRDFTILCRSGVYRNIGDSGYVFFLDLTPQAQQLKLHLCQLILLTGHFRPLFAADFFPVGRLRQLPRVWLRTSG